MWYVGINWADNHGLLGFFQEKSRYGKLDIFRIRKAY